MHWTTAWNSYFCHFHKLSHSKAISEVIRVRANFFDYQRGIAEYCAAHDNEITGLRWTLHCIAYAKHTGSEIDTTTPTSYRQKTFRKSIPRTFSPSLLRVYCATPFRIAVTSEPYVLAGVGYILYPKACICTRSALFVHLYSLFLSSLSELPIWVREIEINM